MHFTEQAVWLRGPHPDTALFPQEPSVRGLGVGGDAEGDSGILLAPGKPGRRKRRRTPRAQGSGFLALCRVPQCLFRLRPRARGNSSQSPQAFPVPNGTRWNRGRETGRAGVGGFRERKNHPTYLATMKLSGGRTRASWMKTWLREVQKPHHGA